MTDAEMHRYLITAIAGTKQIIIEAPSLAAASLAADRAEYAESWNMAEVYWDAFRITEVSEVEASDDEVAPRNPDSAALVIDAGEQGVYNLAMLDRLSEQGQIVYRCDRGRDEFCVDETHFHLLPASGWFTDGEADQLWAALEREEGQLDVTD